MKDNVICHAYIAAKNISLYLKIRWSVAFFSSIGVCFFSIAESSEYILLLPFSILILIPSIIGCYIVFTAEKKSEMSHLCLKNNGLSYGYFYSEEKWEIIPIDIISDVSMRHTLYDRMTGSNTIMVYTARGVFKFHWVQNAGEFVSKANERVNYERIKTQLQKTSEVSLTVAVEPTSTAEKKADNVTNPPEPTAKPVEVKKASPVVENTVQPQNNAVKEEQVIVFCHKCGTKATGDSLFCHKCGTKLARDDNRQ